jgi:chloride channel protein, CIC family
MPADPPPKRATPAQPNDYAETDRGTARSSSTEGLPIAPSMGPTLESVFAPQRTTTVDSRVVLISVIATLIGVAAGVVAQILFGLIGFITNVCFYGRLTPQFVSPSGNHLGLFVIIVPATGGLIVGLMARYGSEAIRGHGIPEVMEQVLRNRSLIMPRLTFLKPISAAIAIGTGGPFGAEGPIIATGGALGSLIGQLLKTTADERKVLLSAGAAAGMAATFGSPVSSILIAVELLLFEFRSRSLIPVTFAAVAATGLRMAVMGSAPIFAMPDFGPPNQTALVLYVLEGFVVGLAAVGITRSVYLIEDAFGLLPIHWMWWPAFGGLFVGVIGYWIPQTLGVGYDNVKLELSGTLTEQTLVLLCAFKFLSWAVSLSSGTSGGTLAPLFIIGGALGAALGGETIAFFPHAGLDLRVAALIGMAAMFAGASRALLASVVFAFETTLQPFALLPLAAGCTAAYLVSSLLMKDTIMTEKIARRGIRVPADYAADFLSQMLVREVASYQVASLRADSTLAEVRSWLANGSPGSAHHGFPVVDAAELLLGLVSRRDLLDPSQPPTKLVGDIVVGRCAVVFEDNTVREASDLMVREGLGRLPVVKRENPRKIVAIISGSDVRSANRLRLEAANRAEQTIRWL